MLSRVSVRGASSAAAVVAAPQKAPSGLTIASDDRNGAIAHLVLAFRAGSRYELPHQKGLVHHVRNFVGRDANSYHGVPLLWSTAGIGANIRAFATREIYGVAVSVPRAEANLALSILGHISSQPSFKPWELLENQETLSADLAYRTAFDFVNDDVHRAAYRNGGLGNGLFAPKKLIGKYSEAELRNFAAARLVSQEGVLFGINVPQETLVNYGENHAPITAGKGVTVHRWRGSSLVVGQACACSAWFVAFASAYEYPNIVGEGAALSDAKGLAAQNVLLALLSRSTLKYGGKNGNGILDKAIANEQAAVSAYQASYSDSGLAGVYLVVDGASAGSAVRTIVKTLKSFTASDLEGAKALAQSRIIFGSENGADFVIDKAAYLLGGKGNCVVSAIGEVTAADVDAAAKRIAKKLAIASYGDIDNVPFADEL